MCYIASRQRGDVVYFLQKMVFKKGGAYETFRGLALSHRSVCALLGTVCLYYHQYGFSVYGDYDGINRSGRTLSAGCSPGMGLPAQSMSEDL